MNTQNGIQKRLAFKTRKEIFLLLEAKLIGRTIAAKMLMIK
jgi:hypothetical protein